MFKLLNREEKYLHEVAPLNAKNREILNGEDIVNLELKSDVVIEKKFRMLIFIKKYNDWKEYIVEEIEEDRTEGIKNVYLENSIYETLGDYIEDKRSINTTADLALGKVLEPSRWEVGRVDSLGKATATFYRTSVKQAIQDICAAWGAELRTRVTVSENKITNRYVDLLSRRGHYLGERFVNSENIDQITRTIDIDSIVTALYGYGKGEEIEDDEGVTTGGFGRRIDFSSINGGKAYIEDNEARLKWGRLNSEGNKSHLFSKIEYDDIEDKEELKNLTMEDLERLKEPRITYEMQITGAVAQIGDTVLIIDKEYQPNLRIAARVYEIETDLLDEGNSKPILGNYMSDITDSITKHDDYINGFRDKTPVWDRANGFDKDGKINTEFIDGTIDVLKNKLLSTVSGWETDEIGNMVFTAKNGSGSMMLTGAGFMIADSKLANGNWNYRTFGTGAGFTADEIVTGVLRGAFGAINFNNGTMYLGKDIENASLLFQDNELSLKLSQKNKDEIADSVASPYSIMLSNENQTFPTTHDGLLPTSIIIKSDIVAYRGITQVDAYIGDILVKSDTGATISTGTVTKLSPTDIDSGWVQWSVGASQVISSDRGYIEIPITIAGNRYIKKLYWNKSKSGTNGEDARLINIIPSNPYFVKKQSGTNYSITPDIIELKLEMQNAVFSNWKYSTNGTDWYNITRTSYAYNEPFYNSTSKTLSVPKAWDNIINNDYAAFKAETTTYETDVQTISILYDVAELEQRVSNSEFKITPQAITSTVERTTTKLATTSSVAKVKQTADGLGIRFEKIDNGEVYPRGTNYYFDKSSFKIGGMGGAKAEHQPSWSKWTHTDGSYTQVGVGGLKRYNAGDEKAYHHLVHAGEHIVGGGPNVTLTFTHKVQLPDEFKGKKFETYVSASQVYNNNNDYKLVYFSALRQHWNTIDGTITLTGGAAVKNTNPGGSPWPTSFYMKVTYMVVA